MWDTCAYGSRFAGCIIHRASRVPQGALERPAEARFVKLSRSNVRVPCPPARPTRARCGWSVRSRPAHLGHRRPRCLPSRWPRTRSRFRCGPARGRSWIRRGAASSARPSTSCSFPCPRPSCDAWSLPARAGRCPGRRRRLGRSGGTYVRRGPSRRFALAPGPDGPYSHRPRLSR